MYYIFYSTSNVFKAEEILNINSIQCRIVPTPVQDRAYCGVCIKSEDAKAESYLSEIEHIVFNEGE